MAELIYATRGEYDGPWFLDRSKVEKLDETLETQWQKVEDYVESATKEEIEKTYRLLQDECERYQLKDSPSELRARTEARVRGRYEFRKSSKLIVLHFEEGDRLVVGSFKEADLHHELSKGRVTEVGVSFYRGEISCRLHVDSQFGTLGITVEPESASVARELFVALRSWAKQSSAPLWQRMWKKEWMAHWIVYFMVISLMAMSLSSGGKRAYRQEAHELIAKGVTEKDIPHAVEVILALTSEYVPPTSGRVTPGWAWLIIVGGFGASILLSISPPNLILGLGEGEARIKRWNQWITIVYYVIPSYIGATFLFPWVAEAIRKRLGW